MVSGGLFLLYFIGNSDFEIKKENVYFIEHTLDQMHNKQTTSV